MDVRGPLFYRGVREVALEHAAHDVDDDVETVEVVVERFVERGELLGFERVGHAAGHPSPELVDFGAG